MELPDTADLESFAWLNMVGVDAWTPFTVAVTSMTVLGTPTYTGRYRAIGRKIEFQISLISTVSIASTAGTTYIALPVTPAKGLAGWGSMQNQTTNVAVGACVVNITNSRIYLPALVASGNTFALFGEYEI